MQLKGSRSRSPESKQPTVGRCSRLAWPEPLRIESPLLTSQIMLATSHRQRAKIRRNGDHRSPRRLKKKGSYSDKTYQKEPKRSAQQLDLRLLRKDAIKVAQLLEPRTFVSESSPVIQEQITWLSAQGSGQPLGYLASWPLFTLSHHLVVCGEDISGWGSALISMLSLATIFVSPTQRSQKSTYLHLRI